MQYSEIIFFVIYIPVLLFSITIHEYAHGWMAEQCGDDTARLLGRITLNPLPHIDIIGTIILPIVFMFSSMHIPIGYAKPVPVNPNRFNNPRKGTILVSISGPIANLLLAVFFALILRCLSLIRIDLFFLKALLLASISVNILLAIFNLLPIPPLDGSGIVSGLLPVRISTHYEQLQPYGFMILLVLLVTGVIGRLTMPVVLLLRVFLIGGVAQ